MNQDFLFDTILLLIRLKVSGVIIKYEAISLSVILFSTSGHLATNDRYRSSGVSQYRDLSLCAIEKRTTSAILLPRN